MVAAALPVTEEQRAELERMAASTSLPHRQVVQARGLLWACEGVANEEIAPALWRGLGYGAALAFSVRRAGAAGVGQDREGPRPQAESADRARSRRYCG